MCGIAGIVTFNGGRVQPRLVQAMGDVLAHRGPDDHRYYFAPAGGPGEVYRHTAPPSVENAAVGFAHRRLSIIDIASGHQPMLADDGQMALCYNGEIYNYRDLRPSLEGDYPFYTECDTEVLLHQMQAHGTDGLAALNGIFAFALWDGRARRLTLARDRFGVKPLYYTITPDAILFASEIKALLQSPDVRRKLDPITLTQHLTFQNQLNERTFFEDIHLLPAGAWLTADLDGNVRRGRYWQMQFQVDHTRTEDDLIEPLREAVSEAVRRQVMSEVPVGTFLSGGMDTGSISALATRHIPDLHTFTCGFDLPNSADKLEQHFDETDAAQDLADRLGTHHHLIRLGSGHNFPSLPHVAWALDEPRLGISYQNWYTSQLIREHVTVVLGGAGGDELFAGYPWRYERALGINHVDDWNRAYYNEWTRLLRPEQRSALFTDDMRAQVGDYDPYDDFLAVMAPVETTDPLHRALYYDFHTFLYGLFVVEDKLSMAHSIESRVPLLDNDLVDLVLTIPSEYKLRDGTSKHILKRAMQGILPDETLYRRKQGFTPPDATWYRGPLRAEVEQTLLSPGALERGYFEPDALEGLVHEHMSGAANHRFLLWSLMLFEWWNRYFIDGETPPEPQPHYSQPTAL